MGLRFEKEVIKMEVEKIFSPVDIAISGLQAQEKNIGVISSNVANSQATDNGEGQPFRRLEAVMKAKEGGIAGVSIDEIVADTSDFRRLLKPGHPDADEQGYVTMPNVNLPIEMMNLNIATRLYQANVAVLKRYQRMVETTLELLR